MLVEEIVIPVKGAELAGMLEVAADTAGLVIFAHGSGSSRHSPRNQFVAHVLHDAGVGTLLFDLLTPQEEQAEARSHRLRFDIPLLANRLIEATRWALDRASSRDLNVGYFGSSTGAGAALVAAARLPGDIQAVVSRGGRPDMAGDALSEVQAPTLLLVGANDLEVLALNEEAYGNLNCEKALRRIPGASHLFEEPGALELVARMASEWFVNHLQPISSRRS